MFTAGNVLFSHIVLHISDYIMRSAACLWVNFSHKKCKSVLFVCFAMDWFCCTDLIAYMWGGYHFLHTANSSNNATHERPQTRLHISETEGEQNSRDTQTDLWGLKPYLKMLVNRFRLRMILQTGTKASENEGRGSELRLCLILLPLSVLNIHSVTFFFSFKNNTVNLAFLKFFVIFLISFYF